MLGNIWLSSALIVTAIFSAGAMYKSYSDIQEAKQIQEHYEIISEIKTLIAKQYNKEPNKITRDEIIAHLPKGENWEKVLLLNRDKSSNLSNKELVNETGNFEISEDEKLKLLALKAKLKDVIDVNSIEAVDKKYTFEVGKVEKNRVSKDIEIENSLNRAIHFLGTEILYSNKSASETMDKLLADENKFIPYDDIYQDFEITDVGELKTKKQKYFKSKIKDRLYKNENAFETRLYKELKDLL
ncbi:MAG: hypothetical protein RBR70_09040 [Arcobacter sp.]|jgi:hypothetical protein|uniref:hypothetical protein n=1 Tax=Arcobacter sp. TaxID=1872629 RepID=UPI002A763B18|nr:hypothetical protein [Arcobacter sp.]MDY3205202.1 hypothetical protein [Arcobacter sp.]